MMIKCDCGSTIFTIDEYSFSIDNECITVDLKCTECGEIQIVDYEAIPEIKEGEQDVR
jgi:hypothetical protein